MVRSIFSLTLALTLVGCASITPSFYKLDVRQGNVVDSKELARIHVGMSKRQVKAILGAPLVEDPFNSNRWDYVSVFYPSGNVSKGTEHRLTLFFNANTVARIGGDLTAKAGTAVAQNAPGPAAQSAASAAAAPHTFRELKRSAQSSLARNTDADLN